MNFFRRLFGKRSEEKHPDRGKESFRAVHSDQEDALVIDMEGLNPDGKQTLYAEIAKSTDFPIHEGRVEHAYALKAVIRTDRCPRCSGQTHQGYADFIYATDGAPRVMFAPAGFFCADCPTVIIDEGIIASGVKKEFAFQGVVGIDHGMRKRPDLFNTWNGKKSVYVLDEDGNPMGISTRDEVDAHPAGARISGAQRATAKRKRKRAKEDRKRNRRN